MFMRFQIGALSKVKWNEVAVRFLFGGAITVATGLIAQRYGPTVGGLFLAFPAIFPASVTLLAKKQREKKAKHGMEGDLRGRHAAALEARGTVMGCVGLVCFALMLWKTLPRWNAAGGLLLATCVWLAFSTLLWALLRRWRHSGHHAGRLVEPKTHA
jgi:hypothetical protein